MNSELTQPAMLRAASKPRQVRYVYRAKYYREPPADWPAPSVPCHLCKGNPLAEASWEWVGYEWRCTRKHEDSV